MTGRMNNRWTWWMAAMVASTTLVACNGVVLPGSDGEDATGDMVDDTDGTDMTDDTGDSTGDTDGTTDDTDAGSANLVVFVDDAEGSTFSTSDVRDVDDEIVQFDANTMSIVWKATGESFQEGSWVTDGNSLGAARSFQVRFGTVNGERRAYFTETIPATICDIRVSGDSLSIFSTNTLVPNEE